MHDFFSALSHHGWHFRRFDSVKWGFLFIVFVPGCIRAACSDKQLLKRLESVKKEVQPHFFQFVALPVMVQRVLHPYIYKNVIGL